MLNKTVILASKFGTPCHAVHNATQINVRHCPKCQFLHGLLQFLNQCMAHALNLAQCHSLALVINRLFITGPMDIGLGLVRLIELLSHGQLAQYAGSG
jgi:hypothetical protein